VRIAKPNTELKHRGTEDTEKINNNYKYRKRDTEKRNSRKKEQKAHKRFQISDFRQSKERDCLKEGSGRARSD